MNPESLHTIASIHGIAAWSSLALLVSASFFARHIQIRIPKAAYLSAAAATLMLSLSACAGFALHMPYQYRLRQRIFIEAPALGRLFERKEHLAFGALMLAWCAAFALAASHFRFKARTLKNSSNPPQFDDISRDLKRCVIFAYAVSALLAGTACIASTIVARRYGLG